MSVLALTLVVATTTRDAGTEDSTSEPDGGLGSLLGRGDNLGVGTTSRASTVGGALDLDDGGGVEAVKAKHDYVSYWMGWLCLSNEEGKGDGQDCTEAHDEHHDHGE